MGLKPDEQSLVAQFIGAILAQYIPNV